MVDGWFDTYNPKLGPDAYPVMVRSDRDAENAAALWLHRLGYTDAVLTAGGRDYGVDVTSAGAVAQVKRWRTKNVGVADVQRLAGSAEPGQACFFFASRGYTDAARAWAEHSEQRVGLFVMRDNGTLIAINRWAYLALCRAPKRLVRPGQSLPPLEKQELCTLFTILLVLSVGSWTLVGAWLAHGQYRNGWQFALFFAVMPETMILLTVHVFFQGLRRAGAAIRQAVRSRSVAPIRHALQIRPPLYAGGGAPDQFLGLYEGVAARIFSRCEQLAMALRRGSRRRALRRLRGRAPLVVDPRARQL